ncbi:hypothetical protein ASF40_16910 [Microbacterium sp. Leaf288]|uniref:trypsin-like peptidase domain-containing protein n=1 Tax=Microbacterium sp. Leaf288 TaxID=1736323 RepID=UPI0006F570B6|nr:trypsin-like peptidase domain-containing protein [Microbacterium sp. Leaf288]KQP69539.1 hypothetical protein ASF40_16910 [Microbacterium sp. Leaf288]
MVRTAKAAVDSHPLDRYPIRWTDPVIRDVRETLAETYRMHSEIMRLVDAVDGISSIEIAWGEPSPIAVWTSVLNESNAKERTRALLATVRQQKPKLADVIDDWLTDLPPIAAREDPAITDAADWTGFSDGGEEERQIVESQPTLLDVVFLELGLQRAKSVCQLRVKFPGRRGLKGTGFRVSKDAILTNHHVLFTKDGVKARDVIAVFDYEVGLDGHTREGSAIRGDPSSIIGDPARDWAVFKTLDPIPPEYPVLPIDAEVELAPDDRVYIIQHPLGLPKMIGMHHNLVRFVDDDVVQYWTDTEAGSSGAPVFDSEWNVVALHHRWTQGQADGKLEYRNQGQRIDRVRADLITAKVRLGG